MRVLRFEMEANELVKKVLNSFKDGGVNPRLLRSGEKVLSGIAFGQMD